MAVRRAIVRPGEPERAGLKTRALEIHVSGEKRWTIGHGAIRRHRGGAPVAFTIADAKAHAQCRFLPRVMPPEHHRLRLPPIDLARQDAACRK